MNDGVAVSDKPDKPAAPKTAESVSGAKAENIQGVTTPLDPSTLSRHIRQPGPAPVHLWDPPYCGEMDMRIARDGTWYHEGSPIRRQALVRLFASVLKKEGDRFFLVTPVEKVSIQVDDCPFLAVAAEITGSGPDQVITLTLNTGEQVTVDEGHRIVVSPLADSDEPHPVVEVRNGLEALLARSVFYQLIELAEERESDGVSSFGVTSKGCFFELGSYSA